MRFFNAYSCVVLVFNIYQNNTLSSALTFRQLNPNIMLYMIVQSRSIA